MPDYVRDKPYAVNSSEKPAAVSPVDTARGVVSGAERITSDVQSDKPRIAGVGVESKPGGVVDTIKSFGTDLKEKIQTYISPRVQGGFSRLPSTTLMEDTVMLMEGNALMGNMLVFDNAPLVGSGVAEKNQLGADILDTKPRGEAYAVSNKSA